MVEEGKQKIVQNGVEYLLELPLRADLALVHAHTADCSGNLTYQLTARNFNPIIALAADLVIAQADQMVDVGSILPDQVITPGALIDYVVVSPEVCS